MNVGEIRELVEGLDDNVEVRFASQPNWPFEYSIQGGEIVDSDPEDPEVEEEAPEGETLDEGVERGYLDVVKQMQARKRQPEHIIIYLYEGNQIGYLPGEVRKVIGWR